MSIRSTIVTAAAIAAIAATAQPALAAQNITKRATVTADAAVDVSNVQGRVDVTAWDRNEVELIAVLESDKDELEFEATDRNVRIKVTRPDRKYWHDGDDDAVLTLRVPKGIRLHVNTVSADVKVAGVRGEQRLGTVSGTLDTQAYDEIVDMHAVSGDITVAGTGGKAAVTSESVSGTTIITGVHGSYEGKAVSGDIRATVAAASRLRAGTVSGDLEISAELAADARVEMKSISGDVGLTVRPPVNAEFEIESFSGDIESCLGGKARAKSKYGPGRELHLTQGSGSARVRIETLSGEVSICDR